MSRKRKRNFLKKNNITIILAVILVIVSVIILVEHGLIENPFANFGRETGEFSARDFCSLIAGNVLHTINNEGECRLQCLAECESRGLNFENSQFTPMEEECHLCNCYCK